MSSKKTGKTLAITGTVLLLNGFIFLLITLLMQSNILWGLSIACLGTGIPLIIVGLLKNKKSKEKAS